MVLEIRSCPGLGWDKWGAQHTKCQDAPALKEVHMPATGGKEEVHRPDRMGKECESICVYKTAMSAEQDFNYQVERITHSFCGYQSVLFLSHSCCCLMGSWTEWPQWQRWKLCLESATWTSTHQSQPDYCHYSVPNLQQRLTLSTSNGTILQSDQPVAW